METSKTKVKIVVKSALCSRKFGKRKINFISLSPESKKTAILLGSERVSPWAESADATWLSLMIKGVGGKMQ